jgi:hypothetical protein
MILFWGTHSLRFFMRSFSPLTQHKGSSEIEISLHLKLVNCSPLLKHSKILHYVYTRMLSLLLSFNLTALRESYGLPIVGEKARCVGWWWESLLLSFNLTALRESYGLPIVGEKARCVGWWWERKVSGSADSGFTDRMSLSLSKLSTVCCCVLLQNEGFQFQSLLPDNTALWF